ncbi:MAG: hypothetical protein NTY37_09855 [Methanothrix sp.]|nr:hypothetical protein [Methanothrix sp.]
MKYIAIFLCLVGLGLAAGYTDWQQGAAEGLNIGFKMGQAYEQAQKGINVTGFNAQVDGYNAWVREHFGEDPMLLMQKLDAPVDLSKPILIANNTTQGGIVHAIDGMNKANGPSYTTNDGNLLPESALDQLMGAKGTGNEKTYATPDKVDYLGGGV